MHQAPHFFTSLMRLARHVPRSPAFLHNTLRTKKVLATMAHVLASVAQYERKVIGQRTREGMAQLRAEGVHVGRPSMLPETTVERIVRQMCFPERTRLL